MNREENHTRTNLNKNDKRVLDRYSKEYTNFIESTTARTRTYDDEKYKMKD
ncbi:hypothetical protein RBH29_08920 [Herbivorax sp. ANBcel31]|uniref:hypothetical protein n=1 Tax=Herbivorax sp. ANBcel31 TaxID=3069754 RepID=UPI0027B717DD|nr:hypothetical protein [Herbivorax sp. ANBcel31]MDQ2086545.1 hypothetical protein [Herbivorax sp. ANBcel31]